MTETDLRIVDGLNTIVKSRTGRKIGDEVMEGSELLGPSSSEREFSDWVKGAMTRMNKLVDQEVREEIMRDCGRRCSLEYMELIQNAKEHYRKARSLDEFLTVESRKDFPGMKLEREGNVLYQIYNPSSFEKPLRCYCSILRGLPSDEMMSLTYCQCSAGFLKSYWEQVLETEVRVEILQSVVSGGKECRFAIHLPANLEKRHSHH